MDSAISDRVGSHMVFCLDTVHGCADTLHRCWNTLHGYSDRM